MKFFPVMDFNRVGVFSFENIVDANGDAVSGDAGNGVKDNVDTAHFSTPNLLEKKFINIIW